MKKHTRQYIFIRKLYQTRQQTRKKMKINQYHPVLPNAKIALVFDVETNGLLDMKKAFAPKLDESPYVLQLSYAMFDLTHGKLIKSVDTYIQIPDHVLVSAETTAVNGITKQKCIDEGYPMLDVLCQFYRDYHCSSMCIAHNYRFDSTMLNIEFQRHWPVMCKHYPYALNLFHPVYMKNCNIRYKCTMFDSIEICKLPHPPKPSTTTTTTPPASVSSSPNTSRISTIADTSSTANVPGPPIVVATATSTASAKPATKTPTKPSYKWPTLSELYIHYFKVPPTGMHNSMMDVWATLRCFVMMETGNTFTNDEFDRLIQNKK